MNDTTCNGFTNKETWNIRLRYHDIFENMAEEQKWNDVQHMADGFEALVNELDYDTLDVNSFAKEAVGEYLERVDWVDIAEHYFVAQEEEQEEEQKKLVEEDEDFSEEMIYSLIVQIRDRLNNK